MKPYKTAQILCDVEKAEMYSEDGRIRMEITPL